jgi:hypothetical protein
MHLVTRKGEKYVHRTRGEQSFEKGRQKMSSSLRYKLLMWDDAVRHAGPQPCLAAGILSELNVCKGV